MKASKRGLTAYKRIVFDKEAPGEVGACGDANARRDTDIFASEGSSIYGTVLWGFEDAEVV